MQKTALNRLKREMQAAYDPLNRRDPTGASHQRYRRLAREFDFAEHGRRIDRFVADPPASVGAKTLDIGRTVESLPERPRRIMRNVWALGSRQMAATGEKPMIVTALGTPLGRVFGSHEAHEAVMFNRNRNGVRDLAERVTEAQGRLSEDAIAAVRHAKRGLEQPRLLDKLRGLAGGARQGVEAARGAGRFAGLLREYKRKHYFSHLGPQATLHEQRLLPFVDEAAGKAMHFLRDATGEKAQYRKAGLEYGEVPKVTRKAVRALERVGSKVGLLDRLKSVARASLGQGQLLKILLQ